jgi:hypothetical protein
MARVRVCGWGRKPTDVEIWKYIEQAVANSQQGVIPVVAMCLNFVTFSEVTINLNLKLYNPGDGVLCT